MKLIRNDCIPNGSGTVTMVAEEPDDIWAGYNLIANGDFVSGDTTRKVLTTSSLGSGEGKNKALVARVNIKLEIKVMSTEYDKQGSVIRIKGKTTSTNAVESGAFHTLEIKLQKPFDLRKKVWNASAIDDVRRSCTNDSKGADLAVVLIQEGLANIFLVKKNVPSFCTQVEGGKKKSAGELKKFFEKVFVAFTRKVDICSTGRVVIAGPGSVKTEFQNYMISKAQRLERSIIAKRSCVMLVDTSSGSKQSLKEVLDAPTIKNTGKDSKDVIYKKFRDTLFKNEDCACYGTKNVESAAELGAVKTLLITDETLKNHNITLRRKYCNLVELVEKSGGYAHILTSTHASEKELGQMTGIAAILHYPLPDLDDM
ncbi:hypothetical protein GIB67_026281 [Kingdonia uniflora]|uniref:Protein pelota homolog n=1 Tax=Kingdonia uniflora TaxID=39325 RepID=A0A7J7LA44_9MAGN|nr:hypothetical protein GIB67_026281 [Kingdonia uniflora]